MTPGLRKFALTAHLASSVGWLGAVAAFLVLGVAGLESHAAETVRGAYLAMNLIGEFMIVPLSAAALLTGIIQSLGTPWGLFRYYWVLVKFVLTFGATFLLLLHQFTAVAEAAKRVSQSAVGSVSTVGPLGTQLVFDAAAAVLVLIGITGIAVYKPWGKTPYGRRKDDHPNEADDSRKTFRFKMGLAIVALVLAAFVVLHLLGGGLGHHGMH